MKFVLFDFGGTLDSDGLPWIDRFHPMYRRAGIESSPEAFQKAFHRADDALATRHRLEGLSLDETLALQAAGVLEILAPEKTDLAAALAEEFLEQSRKFLRRNRELLARLSKRFRLGVVSNFYGNLESVLRGEGMDGFFSVLADSGVLGVEKPNPEIFRHAVKALGAGIQDGWMVGDSLERDIRGAEGLGLAHAWLGAVPSAPCCPRGARIKSLMDLEALLP
ncbi:MAG: HAD family hydrolase [Elusimicrobiota bacterium]